MLFRFLFLSQPREESISLRLVGGAALGGSGVVAGGHGGRFGVGQRAVVVTVAKLLVLVAIAAVGRGEIGAIGGATRFPPDARIGEVFVVQIVALDPLNRGVINFRINFGRFEQGSGIRRAVLG